MKHLILFSGTKSFTKCIEKHYPEDTIVSIDIEEKYNPSICIDLLEWDYKLFFETYIPDYIHGSPVCREFSICKNTTTRNLPAGFILVDKTIEIIEYVRTLNPNLKWTIENPVNTYLNDYIDYNRLVVSYCKYGFNYRKNTYIWYGGFDLILLQCRYDCNSLIDGKYHKEAICFTKSTRPQQQSDEQVLSLEKKRGNYIGYTRAMYRYRIPELLIKSIIDQLKIS